MVLPRPKLTPLPHNFPFAVPMIPGWSRQQAAAPVLVPLALVPGRSSQDVFHCNVSPESGPWLLYSTSLASRISLTPTCLAHLRLFICKPLQTFQADIASRLGKLPITVQRIPAHPSASQRTFLTLAGQARLGATPRQPPPCCKITDRKMLKELPAMTSCLSGCAAKTVHNG